MVFQCINIRRVPWEVLKTMFDPYIIMQILYFQVIRVGLSNVIRKQEHGFQNGYNVKIQIENGLMIF